MLALMDLGGQAKKFGRFRHMHGGDRENIHGGWQQQMWVHQVSLSCLSSWLQWNTQRGTANPPPPAATCEVAAAEGGAESLQQGWLGDAVGLSADAAAILPPPRWHKKFHPPTSTASLPTSATTTQHPTPPASIPQTQHEISDRPRTPPCPGVAFHKHHLSAVCCTSPAQSSRGRRTSGPAHCDDSTSLPFTRW